MLDGSGINKLIETIKYGTFQDVANIIVQNIDLVKSTDSHVCTPLHIAAAWSRFDVARFLIMRGANVNALTYTCDTPLHYAYNAGSVAIVELLISAGARRYERNVTGYTPEMLFKSQASTR